MEVAVIIMLIVIACKTANQSNRSTSVLTDSRNGVDSALRTGLHKAASHEHNLDSINGTP